MVQKRSRKRLFWLIGLAVVVVVALVAMISSKKREKTIMVTTDKAFRKNVTQLVTGTGKIQPEVAGKIAPEVSGEIMVKRRDLVHRHQLLVRITPDAYKAQVESQQAALSAARSSSVQNRATLAKAEQDYKRAQQLFKSGLLPEADRNTAPTQYDTP